MTEAEVKQLILTIIKPLVSKPEAIEITTEEIDCFLNFNLSVDSDDIGQVIGKQGRVAHAIRTIVYSARLNGNRRIRLNIMD